MKQFCKRNLIKLHKFGKMHGKTKTAAAILNESHSGPSKKELYKNWLPVIK